MFNNIKIFKKITGEKIFYSFVSTFFLSFISSILELIGISLLAVFAVSLSDPSIIIKKIPFQEIKLFFYSLENIKIISLIGIIIIFAFIFKHLVTFLIFFFEVKTIKKLTLKLKSQLFVSYLYESYEVHLNRNKSEIISIISSQLNGFLNYIYNFFTICKELILILIIFCGMLLVNWTVILSLSFILLLLLFFFSKFFKKKLNEIGNKVRTLQEHEIRHLNESFQSFRFIRLANKENFFLDILLNINNKKNQYEIIHFLIGKLPKIYSELIIIIIFITFVILILTYSTDVSTIYGTITFLAFSIVRLLPSFISLNNSYTNLSFYKSSFEKIISQAEKSIITDKNIKTNVFEQSSNFLLEKICFKDVDFEFLNNENKKTLKNINFSLDKNDVLGILGSSGSGKSTILNLMCGLLSPTRGKVLLNDKDISNIKNMFRMSFISQDTYLHDIELKKNITLGDSNETINNIKLDKVIKLSNLHNFIYSDPDKLNKITGDGGSKISSGQKQRVGIARALYFDPELLIIDEGLNALDYQNEEEIMRNILQNNKGIVVLVSHRIETFRFCNKLLILDSGKMIDFGEREEVLKRNDNLNKYFKDLK